MKVERWELRELTWTPTRATDPIVRGVTLSIEPGQMWALAGPNGAGKSTLLHLLAGLEAGWRGDILYGASRLEQMSTRDRARTRSVMLQRSPQAFEHTALELVLMGRHAHASAWSFPGASERQEARDALARVELGERVEARATELSGGELARVWFARTQHSRAPWWLLDEPTAHLDPRHQRRMLETVRAHCEAGGGALVVMHDLNLVERYFDRVALMRSGEVVAAGDVHEVMTEARLTDVYGLKMCALEGPEHRVWTW